MSEKDAKTIGIIGGGQLGRMLAMAAAHLGRRVVILDPQAEAPAFQCANEHIVAAFDDADALSKLAQMSDVITYEFENVNVDALRKLESTSDCHPNTKALSTSQDRLVEKTFFRELGIGTAPFFDIDSITTLEVCLKETNHRGILKTRRMGYDGKGQVRISDKDPDWMMNCKELIENAPCILEGFVDFDREISIIAARDKNGRIEAFDVGENVHKNGILYTTTVPADVSDNTRSSAYNIAEKVLSALDYVGVIGIELFVMNNGELIANEFAPRVHNSGHWTEAACLTSQFEQHIRAVSGLPLAKTTRHSNCVMQNLIGDEVNQAIEILKRQDTLLHLYGKAESRPGRKMGHFTTLHEK
ncbi:MAG: 5-(carboxyamino)imidazole ribonucleotide synthase [Pseudomonadota bacterium]